MDSIKKKLQTTTYTISSAHQRLGLLRQVMEEVFFGSDTPEASVAKRYQAAVANLSPLERQAVTALGVSHLDDWKAESIHHTLTALLQWLDVQPVITLYVPVVFADRQIEILGQWFREEISDDVWLDIMVDPNVVGGCALIVNNIYHDLSLRTFLADDRTIVPKIIARYESV